MTIKLKRMTFTMKHSLIVVAVIGSATALGVLLFIFAFNGNLQYAPTIRLPQGRVRGTVEAVEEGGGGGDGGKVFLYQAVRYATAKRFEKAQLISKNENQENGDDKEPPIYDAILPRDNCPQLGLDSPQKTYTSTTYSEDCLYLNIWSRMEPRSNRSVMVYFFGGAFMYGSIFEGIHDGRYLAHRGDVIVVTVNYRLNAFGFLGSTSSSSSLAVSNLGLHDQLLGLRWIAENIGHFGGNKDSVTIFGNSAGSMAVSGLLLSPLSVGLFSRAILQSGVLLSPPSVEEALESVAKIAAFVPGCPPEEKNPETLLNGCLRQCSTEELLNATRDSGVSLGPVYGDELLPRRPIDLLLNPEEFNAKVQLLFGTVRDEGFGMALGRFPELNNDSLAEDFLTFNSTREYIVQLVGPRFGPEAAEFYLQRANLSASNSGSLNDFREVINQAYGDFSITCPTFLFGSQFIKPTLGQNGLSHYAWLLTRPAAVHIMRACREGWAAGTVCHADDLFSLFTIASQRTEADRAVSRAIRDSWASFARSGKMAGEGVVHWPEAVQANRSSFVMALDSTFHLLENVHRETCEHFWRARIFV